MDPEDTKKSTESTVNDTTATERNTVAKNDNIEKSKQLSAATQVLTQAITDKKTATLAATEASKINALVDDKLANIKETLSKKMRENSDILIALPTLVLGASAAMNKYNESLKSTIGSESTATAAFESLSKKVQAMPVIADGVEEVSNLLNAASDKFKEAPKNILAAMDATMKMKESFLASAAASGNVAASYDLIKGSASDTGAYLGALAYQFKNTANAMGIMPEVAAKYHSKIQALPPALVDGARASNVLSGSLGNAVKGFDFTTAAAKVAEGSFSSFDDAIGDITNAINNYNASQESALAFTAQIGKLTNDLGVPIDSARKYMEGFSSSMKFAGDNIQSSSTIFARLYDGFKQTGVSAQAAAELVSQFTGRLTNLSVTQKAFVSAQSGGPGGLQGAFQIENLIRKGKTDEVFEKVKSTMQKQLGGRIVSLEEAGQSQEAASQYQKQRLMLRSGPLGSFADTDDKAARILEGFAKGFSGKDMLSSDAITQSVGRSDVLSAPRISAMSVTNANLEAQQMQSNIQMATFMIEGATMAGNNAFTSKLRDSTLEAQKQGKDLEQNLLPKYNFNDASYKREDNKLDLSGTFKKDTDEIAEYGKIVAGKGGKALEGGFNKIIGAAGKEILELTKKYSELKTHSGTLAEAIKTSAGGIVEVSRDFVSSLRKQISEMGENLPGKESSLKPEAMAAATTNEKVNEQAKTAESITKEKESITQSLTVKVDATCPHCKTDTHAHANTMK
jgi:hypothetical protein